MITVYTGTEDYYEFPEATQFTVDFWRDVVLYDEIGLKVGVVAHDHWKSVVKHATSVVVRSES